MAALILRRWVALGIVSTFAALEVSSLAELAWVPRNNPICWDAIIQDSGWEKRRVVILEELLLKYRETHRRMPTEEAEFTDYYENILEHDAGIRRDLGDGDDMVGFTLTVDFSAG